MNIFQFADLIGRQLIIRRYQGSRPSISRFTCDFEYGVIKDSSFPNVLQGLYGDGSTVNSAISDYVKKIRGKRLIFNATDPHNRTDWGVPKDLKTVKL